jgi:hypothetical protein
MNQGFPVDFNEIIAGVAPRPVLIIAPEHDKDAHLQDIKNTVEQASYIYKLYGSPENIQLQVPYDINRFSPEIREDMAEWLMKKVQVINQIKIKMINMKIRLRLNITVQSHCFSCSFSPLPGLKTTMNHRWVNIHSAKTPGYAKRGSQSHLRNNGKKYAALKF